MRVVTLNCWKNEGDLPRRAQLIAEGLLSLSPDIVFLQEVYRGPDFDAGRAIADLVGMHIVSHPARAKDRGCGPSTSGLATLTRWTVQSAEALELPCAPEDGQRIVQCICVETPMGPFRLLNLHLTHLRSVEAEQLRLDQLRAALQWATAQDCVPLILAGDFNADISRDPLANELRSWRVEFGADDWSAFPASLISGGGNAIDHVGLLDVSGAYALRERRLVLSETCPLSGLAASDHAGVMLSVQAIQEQGAHWSAGRN